jgi:trigger factor
LEVKIDKPSTCQRHISVTISSEDIQRYFDDACAELMPKAAVPGFRAGRAPRKLVETRFRKDLSDQVKSSLLMDAMTQVTEEYDFSAISEPDFDYSAVEVPNEGPMTFEFDLEVRPEFDVPNWRGLQLERPVRATTTKDVDQAIERLLQQESELVDSEGPVAEDDFVLANLVFRFEGQELSRLEDELIQIRPILSFSDATLNHFDTLLIGAQPGDRRQGKVVMSYDSPREDLRGKDVEVEIELVSVQRPGPPAVTLEYLDSVGMKTEQELRDAVEERLSLQMEYYQQRRIRQQITALLTKGANWELPPDLVRRQARRELDRAILELRRSGFGDREIQARRNELRQDSLAATERALKEHFILERIAEELDIEANPRDYEAEIAMIAKQTDSTERATRAQIERHGMSDALRNQIIERKVLATIASEARFTDVPFEPAKERIEAVEHFVGGVTESSIPTAKHAGEPEELRQPTDYT